jgi:hypothetical protein
MKNFLFSSSTFDNFSDFDRVDNFFKDFFVVKAVPSDIPVFPKKTWDLTFKPFLYNAMIIEKLEDNEDERGVNYRAYVNPLYLKNNIKPLNHFYTPAFSHSCIPQVSRWGDRVFYDSKKNSNRTFEELDWSSFTTRSDIFSESVVATELDNLYKELIINSYVIDSQFINLDIFVKYIIGIDIQPTHFNYLNVSSEDYFNTLKLYYLFSSRELKSRAPNATPFGAHFYKLWYQDLFADILSEVLLKQRRTTKNFPKLPSGASKFFSYEKRFLNETGRLSIDPYHDIGKSHYNSSANLYSSDYFFSIKRLDHPLQSNLFFNK